MANSAGQKSQESGIDQKSKLLALMGGGGGAPGAGGGSVGSQSNGLLANLLGNAGGAAGVTGSGFGLNLPSVTDAGGPQMPQTFAEFNMPSRPGYQMVSLNAIQNPLPQQPTEKHVSYFYSLRLRDAWLTKIIFV